MARRAGPKHSTGVEETYARGRMGVLAALATLALVGTGAAGAFAATTIPQSDATSEDVTPAVAMVVDDADTPAVITGDTADQDPTEDATPVPPEDPAPAPAPAPTPEVTTPTDTTAPTPTEASKPSGEGEVATTTDQLETDIPAEDADAQSDGDGAMLLAVGPDGGTPPYVYWDVRDTEGNLVPGATFSFEARIQSGFLNTWSWNLGSNAGAINDCDGTCSTNSSGNVLDRDGDGGEFLLEHRGTNRNDTNRIAAGSNYRVSQVNPPAGYVWETTGQNTRTIGTTNGNAATWNNDNGDQTHNFGTFQVRKVQTLPVCTPGTIYGISGGGQLQQITQGNVTNLGSTVSGQSNMNGLGIGSDGQPVYAIARSNSQGTSISATVYEYNTTTGAWASVSNSSGNTNTNLVGGAVNLKTGIYYFGGFRSNGNFTVYEFDPSKPLASRISLKGTVVTDATTNANGDMAFDQAGNLYIVRGDGSSSTVYSVTAANFEAASGGNIQTEESNSFTTMNDVNGITFDSDGKIYLGSSGTVRSYDMPGFTNMQTVVSSGLSSTDLAGCGSPPTIVIEKEVIGGRVNSGDQFRMTLRQGNTLLGETTTAGTATGVQDQRVGPLPTVRNVALNFAEYGANGANLGNYASAYQCTVTHRNGTVENLQQVNGTSGSITIPTTGDAVRCVFRNSPLVANVTINKQVTDALGQNPQPDAGWLVSAITTATTGTATQAPTATTQTTNASGNADWRVTFGTTTARATVTVSETVTSKPGYEFLSGQCVVTGLDGSTATTTLTGPDATGLTGVKPGDSVACTYVNKPATGTLVITKAFDESVPTGSGTDVEFTGTYSCELPTGNEVASGTWTSTGTGAATLTPAADQLPAGAICSATEDQPSGNEGLPNSSWEWGTPSEIDDVTIAANDTGTITVTNKAKRVYGNFSVTKVVPEGSVVAEGMEFSGDWSCTLGTGDDAETVTGTWGPIAADETWTSDDAEEEIPLGAACTATEENRAETPGVDGYVWDGDPEITPADGVEATNGDALQLITVINKTEQVLGSATWVKIGAEGTTNPLAGSEWSLEGPDGSATVTIEDCVADEAEDCTGPDKDPAAGQFQLIDLPWGDYTLTETKAPPGYVISGESIVFTIGTAGGASLEVGLGDIVNHKAEGPKLPLTGGQSAAMFTILGGGLLGAALLLTAVKRRKGGAAHRA